jgi:hypothetical protein
VSLTLCVNGVLRVYSAVYEATNILQLRIVFFFFLAG